MGGPSRNLIGWRRLAHLFSTSLLSRLRRRWMPLVRRRESLPSITAMNRMLCGSSFPSHPLKRISHALKWAIPVLWMSNAAFAQVVDRQVAMDQPVIAFDIPSQRLAAALDAYGAATGLDIYFDGALAEGHYSNVVRGSFAPASALRMLLERSGFVAELAQSNGVTILPGTKAASARVPATRNYEPYFAVIQAGIGKLFCSHPETWPGSGSVVIRLWIGEDGSILRSEAPALGGEPSRSHIFAAALQNIRLDATPPADMPQPLTMVVLPRSPGEVGCTPARIADEAK
jgi:hypothetical protein